MSFYIIRSIAINRISMFGHDHMRAFYVYIESQVNQNIGNTLQQIILDSLLRATVLRICLIIMPERKNLIDCITLNSLKEFLT